MKTTGKLIIFVLTFLALVGSAYAQSPREQLQQMVEQLQRTPTDNALRERIIRLGADINPAPAVPEEANRFFVRGNVFQKEAKDASGYELAISAYRDALRVAPWWGDAYFNLAVALESVGKFDDAIASIKLYMTSVQAGSAEAREAQNRIYALEAKGEMASKQTAIAAAREVAKRERANSPQARAEALVAILRNQYAGPVTKLMICGENLNKYWRCTQNDARGNNWKDYLAEWNREYWGMYKSNPVTFEVVEGNAGKIRLALGKRAMACGIANGTDPNNVKWVFCDGSYAGQSYGTFRFIPSSADKPMIEFVYGCVEGGQEFCRREQFIFN